MTYHEKKHSIYNKNPEIWVKIARNAPSILLMAKHFSNASEMGRVLGLSSSAVSKWMGEHCQISASSERKAAKWVSDRMKSDLFPETLAPAPTPVAPPPAPVEDTAEMIVICPAGKAAKVQRMLTLMGCVVETI